MSHHHSHHNSHNGEALKDGSHHHITPFSTYLNVLLILLVLTVFTVGVSRVDFGAANALVAMAVASVKAGLVLAYFMHLKDDDKLYLMIILLSVFFLLVMYFFSELDIATRVMQMDAF